MPVGHRRVGRGDPERAEREDVEGPEAGRALSMLPGIPHSFPASRPPP